MLKYELKSMISMVTLPKVGNMMFRYDQSCLRPGTPTRWDTVPQANQGSV